jgi:hypothetical protein
VLVTPPDSLAFFQGVIDFEAETVTITRPTWTGSVSFSPADTAATEQRSLLSEPGWVVCVVEDRPDNADDAHAEIPCQDGGLRISSLLPGAYVAWYQREKVTETVDPTTGQVTMRSSSTQSFRRVNFKVGVGHTSVALPASLE